MCFNAAKSNVVIFSRNQSQALQSVTYSVNGDIIPQSETVKYLGVLINSNLKWDKHIEYIYSKARRILALIKHTLYQAPPQLKKVAYLTLCRPILEYACEVWDPTNKDTIYRLEVLQNKAVRFIYNIKGRDVSMTSIKEANSIQTLQKRRETRRHNTFVHILQYDEKFPNLRLTLDKMQANTHINTRGSSLLPLTCNTNMYLNSFLPRTSREIRTGSTIAAE